VYKEVDYYSRNSRLLTASKEMKKNTKTLRENVVRNSKNEFVCKTVFLFDEFFAACCKFIVFNILNYAIQIWNNRFTVENSCKIGLTL
jgi:hypothetical protein